MDMNVIDEKHPSKVAGVFDSEQSAMAAQDKLINQGQFKAEDIDIVHPDDANISEKIEPHDSGIAKTLVNSHIVFGIVGLVIGLLLALVLVMIGPDMFKSSPLMVFFALAFVGGLLGLMFAGAFALRPDQDPLITDTVEATHEHRWSVMVQIDNDDANERAQKLMEETALSVSHTL